MTAAAKTSYAEPPLYLLVVSEPARLSVVDVARRLQGSEPVHGMTPSGEPVVALLRYVPTAVGGDPLRDELAAELARVAEDYPAHRVRVLNAREVTR